MREKSACLVTEEQAAEAYEMTLAVNTYPLLFPQCMLASYPAEVGFFTPVVFVSSSMLQLLRAGRHQERQLG